MKAIDVDRNGSIYRRQMDIPHTQRARSTETGHRGSTNHTVGWDAQLDRCCLGIDGCRSLNDEEKVRRLDCAGSAKQKMHHRACTRDGNFGENVGWRKQ